MNSIIQQNNQATEDIFTHHILPYFTHKNIGAFSKINQETEETMYETFINNITQTQNYNFLKYHKNIVGGYLKNYHLTSQLMTSEILSCLKLKGYGKFHQPKIKYDENLPEGYFDKLVNLTYLEIDNCKKLTEGCFNNLMKLTQLKVSNYWTLPEGCFNNLMNLTHLEIDNCEKIPEGCFNNLMNLTHLGIDKCIKFSKLIFDNLVNLTHLKLNKCKHIPENCFDNLVNLTHLKLNKCKHIPEHHFNKLSKLNYLEINKCKIHMIAS